MGRCVNRWGRSQLRFRKADGFVITVRGDLDGDGVLSEFSRSGRFGSAGRLLLVEDTKFDAELE